MACAAGSRCQSSDKPIKRAAHGKHHVSPQRPGDHIITARPALRTPDRSAAAGHQIEQTTPQLYSAFMLQCCSTKMLWHGGAVRP